MSLQHTLRTTLAILLLLGSTTLTHAHSEISGTVRNDESSESHEELPALKDREAAEHSEIEHDSIAGNKNRNAAESRESENLSYEEVKTKMLARIDAAIAKVDQALQKISTSTHLSNVTKETLTTSLQNLKTKLEGYRSNVEKTATVQELRTLNEQVLQYFKENKDAIKSNITQAIGTIADEAIKKSAQIQKKVEQILTFLKVTCPTQKENIATLESMLGSLQQETAELQENLKKKDKQAIAESLQEIADLSKGIYEKSIEIQAGCGEK